MTGPYIIEVGKDLLIINALRTGQVSIQFDGRSVLLNEAQSKEALTALACVRSLARIEARKGTDPKGLDGEAAKAG